MAAKIFLELPGGQKMPALGLGTGLIKTKEALERTLNAALEIGYRHFDTAYMYENEALIGTVLKEWLSSGKLKREDLFITTKLPVHGVHKDRVEKFIKESLNSLQLDYVDLYLIHFPIGVKYVEGKSPFDPDREVDVVDHIAVWKAMEAQVDAGRAKHIGLSNFNVRQITNILKSARIKPACLQVELHVDLQQRELVKFCQENGIVVVAYSPLGAHGSDRMGVRKVPRPLNNETVTKIAKKHNKTNAQVTLRYFLQKNIIVIPKTENVDRLKENINVFDFKLDASDIKALDSLEVGEDARLITGRLTPDILQHPEYPYPVNK